MQTVLDRSYLAGIFTGLRAAGLAVLHVLLDAGDDVLRRRVEACGEAGKWRVDHLAAYRQARRWLSQDADLVLDTAAVTAAQAARQIASVLPDVARTRP